MFALFQFPSPLGLCFLKWTVVGNLVCEFAKHIPFLWIWKSCPSLSLHFVAFIWSDSILLPASCTPLHTASAPPPTEWSPQCLFWHIFHFLWAAQDSGESLGIGGDVDWRLNFSSFTVNQKERESAILFTLMLFLSEFLYTGHNFSFNHFLTKTKTDY